MTLRILLLKILPVFFTLYLTIHNIISSTIMLLFPSMIQSYTMHYLTISYRKLTSPKSKIQHLEVVLKILSNCSISLILAFVVLDYHWIFGKFALVVAHHVHHWFISMICDVEDYSFVVEQSLAFKQVLFWAYLGFGYLGIQLELALTIDLIFLFNLPTIIIYKLLARVYKALIQLIQDFYQYLLRSPQTWLTIKIDPIYLRNTFKVFYAIGIIIFAQLLVVVSFYYLWLALVIFCLKMIINCLLNLIQFCRFFGKIMVSLKGFQQENQSFVVCNLDVKTKVKNLFSIFYIKFKWKQIIDFESLINIFEGKDLFTQNKAKPLKRYLVSISSNFKIFQTLAQTTVSLNKNQ